MPTNGGPLPTDEQPEKHTFGGVAPETAHERKDLPAQEHAPRRRPPDTAHGRKGLPCAGTRPSAKASRHGARAKGVAPRENVPHGEGLPTRRTSERVCPTQKRSPRRNAPHGEGIPTRHTSERICPARERSPRRRHPDTAHERKDLPHARRLSSAKASRHGARAKGFAPAGFALAPRADERRAALGPQTAEKHPFGGVAPTARAAAAEFIHRKKNKTTP